MIEAAQRTEEIEEQTPEIIQAPEPVLYSLDEPTTTVAIDADGIELFHRIGRPTLQHLIDRDNQAPQRTKALGDGMNRIFNTDALQANANLWDKYATEVKGYEWEGIEPEHWIKMTPELAAAIPFEHKSQAIVALYEATYELEKPKGRGFVLGATTFRVSQTFGPYVIWHVFKTPSHGDRRKYSLNASETQYKPGSRNIETTTYNRLKTHVEVYDSNFDHLEGVTGRDSSIAIRKDLVDPLWKRAAVECLMGHFDASLRDSKKS